METKEQELRQEHAELEAKLQDPAIYATPDGQKVAKRHAELTDLLALFDEKHSLEKQQVETKALTDENSELGELAAEELPEIEAKLATVDSKLEEALIPTDPNDGKDAIVEIRAGAGGDEAAIFAGDLFRMYSRYCETNGFKMELISESPADQGGYKEIIFNAGGSDAYGHLKYESGVHRVQRIPQTESGGRIHTSTATVAVLPEAEEHDVEIDPSDLRIDIFRSSGPGGQSVNTTDSAVRITHVPTGVVATCQDEKSQHKNKAKAMNVLRSRLLQMKLEEEQKAQTAQRQSQIGSGDRSEKIRTYNFPQDRVTDHRINLSLHNLPGFLEGEIGEMIDKLREAERDLRRKQ